MIKASILTVDTLVKNAIKEGLFQDSEEAADALHEWLLYHEKHPSQVAPTDATGDPSDRIGDSGFQAELMKSQDA